MTPVVCAYCPVRKLLRLGEHNGMETKKFLNRAPSLAMRSIFGVFATGWPRQLNASQRRSSTRMKMMLGRAAASAAGAASQPPTISAATRHIALTKNPVLTAAGDEFMAG